MISKVLVSLDKGDNLISSSILLLPSLIWRKSILALANTDIHTFLHSKKCWVVLTQLWVKYGQTRNVGLKM